MTYEFHVSHSFLANVIHFPPSIQGCTHRATEALRWLSMSRYQCIESVCSCVDLWVHFFLATEHIH